VTVYSPRATKQFVLRHVTHVPAHVCVPYQILYTGCYATWWRSSNECVLQVTGSKRCLINYMGRFHMATELPAGEARWCCCNVISLFTVSGGDRWCGCVVRCVGANFLPWKLYGSCCDAQVAKPSSQNCKITQHLRTHAKLYRETGSFWGRNATWRTSCRRGWSGITNLLLGTESFLRS